MVPQVAGSTENGLQLRSELVTNKYVADVTFVVSGVKCGAATCYLSGMQSRIIRRRRA
jgi:hypothetical protein